MPLRSEDRPMDQLVPTEPYSPYRIFTAERWAEFRADTPMTLTDLAIHVARLNAASLHFEERYAHLTRPSD